jgi:hypothetical protein
MGRSFTPASWAAHSIMHISHPMHFSTSTVTDKILSFVFSISAPPFVPNFTLIKANGMPKQRSERNILETFLCQALIRGAQDGAKESEKPIRIRPSYIRK